eukprot:3500669-Prymnesium_polylepis.1
MSRTLLRVVKCSGWRCDLGGFAARLLFSLRGSGRALHERLEALVFVQAEGVVLRFRAQDLLAELILHDALAAAPRIVARLADIVVRTGFATISVAHDGHRAAAVARNPSVVSK